MALTKERMREMAILSIPVVNGSTNQSNLTNEIFVSRGPVHYRNRKDGHLSHALLSYKAIIALLRL